jgi:hypothetical protein
MVLAIAFYFVMSMGVGMSASDPCACLPKDVKRTDIVSAELAGPGGAKGKRITVEQKLKEIKARCRQGKLIDPKGKEIHFFQLQGCWGNPPEGYQEILNQQQLELEKLKKRYRVIEMTCNPSGEQIF